MRHLPGVCLLQESQDLLLFRKRGAGRHLAPRRHGRGSVNYISLLGMVNYD
jgi:hypothetical protein